MFSTFKPEDVTLLLKDISDKVVPLSSEEREKRIQSGVHYSEMLPLEYAPTEKYLEIFSYSLEAFAQKTAYAVANVALKIWANRKNGLTLVSLARAGTPIGILIKRYLDRRFSLNVPHYTISIIRGKGIDKKAMDYILSKHDPESIRFVDGWTGKGAIQRQLDEAMIDYPTVNAGLAVLSDPACVAELTGTYEDFLIASSCLNSTSSGLISRTFCDGKIITPDDFHGVAFYSELAAEDKTYSFIDRIEKEFTYEESVVEETPPSSDGLTEAKEICEKFDVGDINFVKPSIGETTRVLLRRYPWKILVWSKTDEKNLSHIYQLAREKNVVVEEYPLENYRACGIIKNLSKK